MLKPAIKQLFATAIVVLTLTRAPSALGQIIAPITDCLPDPALACWLQRPDATTNGVDVLATLGTNSPTVADDFIACTNRITDIYIWGSWLNDQFDPNATMTLDLWSDQPATTNSPSHPLTKIGWSGVYGPHPTDYQGPYSVSLVASGLATEKFMDPTSPCPFLGTDTNIYCYHFTIPQNASPQLVPGAIYWLAVTATNTTNLFGWKTCLTNDHHLDDGVFTNALSGNGWVDLRYPPCHPFSTNTMDLAFALVTKEDDVFCNLSCGLGAVTLLWPTNVVPSGKPETILLNGNGPTEIFANVGPKGETYETDSSGLDQAATEMVSLQLSGVSQVLTSLGLNGTNPVKLNLSLSPANRSTGLITETANSVPGRLDVPSFGGTNEANSYFDVYFQVQAATATFGNLVFLNPKPKRMKCVITDKPPGRPAPHGRNTYFGIDPVLLTNAQTRLQVLLLLSSHVPVSTNDRTPDILISPFSHSTLPNVPTVFEVTAAALDSNGAFVPPNEITYQWYSNSVPIAGASYNTYTNSSPQNSDSGTSYFVLVSVLDGGTIASDPVTLTVGAPTLAASLAADGSITVVGSDPNLRLQSASSPAGPWSAVGTAGSTVTGPYNQLGLGPIFTITPAPNQQFFRGLVPLE